MEILQTACMTTKGKYTVLSIEYKITICEHLGKGSSKSEIASEYKITVFINFMYIGLSKLFDYLNKSLSQWSRIIEGAL